MTTRIDARFLKQACGQAPETLSAAAAAHLAETLGWLAPWWLPPAVLARAAAHRPAYRRYTNRPALPSDPGGCWVIFVCPPTLPALRRAFALPLQWQDDVEHDPHLPLALRPLADQVRRQVFPEGGDRWCLRLAQPQGEAARDLSGLDGDAMGVSSGWAALLGGLLLARDGWVPNAHVWASAAWHEEYGVGKINDLPEKLDLAAEWEARQVFVPAQNQPDLSAWRSAGRRPDVEFLEPVSRSPKATGLLEQYLDQLGTEPLPDESFERRRRFYAGANRRRADECYWERLLEEVIARCRERQRARHPKCRPTHLVTVVGNQRSVVALAPRALEVEDCLLLYEKQANEKKGDGKQDSLIEKNRDKIIQLLRQHDIEPKQQGLELGQRDEELRQIHTAVRDFAAGVPPERLAFDLTPGYKFLSQELEEAAPTGSWLLYCRHEQLPPDNRVDPGTEHYDCWLRP